jgi:Bacterial regulatory proteins, luxR family
VPRPIGRYEGVPLAGGNWSGPCVSGSAHSYVPGFEQVIVAGLSPGAGGLTAGAVVVRAPVIITALREYFEMLWERATPVKGRRPASGPRGGLSSTRQMVLGLMAEGLQDDAIAHRLGISTTTVRRHIAVM